MQRFIVGTGRCGSTLLSRMLAESPHLLSLSEFFNGLDMSERFAPEPIDGETLAELIGREQPVITAVIKRGGVLNLVALAKKPYRISIVQTPARDKAWTTGTRVSSGQSPSNGHGQSAG